MPDSDPAIDADPDTNSAAGVWPPPPTYPTDMPLAQPRPSRFRRAFGNALIYTGSYTVVGLVVSAVFYLQADIRLDAGWLRYVLAIFVPVGLLAGLINYVYAARLRARWRVFGNRLFSYAGAITFISTLTASAPLVLWFLNACFERRIAGFAEGHLFITLVAPVLAQHFIAGFLSTYVLCRKWRDEPISGA